MSKADIQLPEVLEYEDFRTFLKDWFQASKKQDSKMSFRYLSLRSGLKSTNYWKLIMEGKRNLSLPMITRFSKTLQLDSVRSHYFHHLVRMNQSKATDERSFHARYVLKLRAEMESQNITRTPNSIYEKWYHPMLREVIALDGFKEDPIFIADLLYRSITPDEAEEGVAALEQNGLVHRDINNNLKVTESVMSTGNKVHGALAKSHIKHMILESPKALEFFNSDEREFRGQTLSLDDSTYTKCRELTQRFARDIMQVANDPNMTAPNRVFQLNIQFFPLSENITKV